MAKIHKLYIYPLKEKPSLSDYLLGTNRISNKKTQNFQISDILNLANNSGSTQSIVLYGSITWISGLTYYATEIGYVINGQYYVTPPAYITLDDADSNLDRIDVFAVTTSSDIIVLDGVPSANPLEPTVDFSTQLRITTAYVAAGESEPQGVSEEIIYNEYLLQPNEWTVQPDLQSNSAVYNFEDLTNPSRDLKHIKANAITKDDSIIFSNDNLFDINDYSSLSFDLKLFSNNQEITIELKFFNDNTFLGGTTFFNGQFGLDISQTSAYQIINIPIEFIKLSNSEFNKIQFKLYNRDTLNYKVFFLDNIRFVTGIDNPISVGTFLGLSDVFETTYSNKRTFVPTVNSDETGLLLKDIGEIELNSYDEQNYDTSGSLLKEHLSGIDNKLGDFNDDMLSLDTQLSNHENNTNNPHQVTKEQVGLGNVDNTSDADKPVSTAQQNALDLKADKSKTYPIQTLNTESTIDLGYFAGNQCNKATPNSNTTYTYVNAVLNGYATVRINAATEPTITGATKITVSDFEANTDMDMCVQYDGVRVEYFFLKL